MSVIEKYYSAILSVLHISQSKTDERQQQQKEVRATLTAQMEKEKILVACARWDKIMKADRIEYTSSQVSVRNIRINL